MVQGEIAAVILAGGSGTRLWPISRLQLPKQFLNLLEEKSLFSATLERLDGVVPRNNTLVVTSQLAAGTFPPSLWENCRRLIEPAARNTAPAIAVAAEYLQKSGDPVIVVLPSDHAIADSDGFRRCLGQAIDCARAGQLVTFAIKPTHAESGFGYLRLSPGNCGLSPVHEFKEKPDENTASEMIATGMWFWNSGMFVWKASEILKALKTHAPEVHEVAKQISRAADVDGWPAALRQHFHEFPNISIDHAVMEKARNVSAIPADIGWSDVGNWDAVHSIAKKDKTGNAVDGDVISIDSSGCLIRGSGRLIASIGVSDLTIVDTPDALLVARRGRAQEIRTVVEVLEKRKSQLHVQHATTVRPWGSYTVLKEAPGYKLKSITVSPGGRLSLQRHKFRSEHWVVISGVATVTCGESVKQVLSNESTFIPVGALHRLENLGTEELEIVEVQVGSYVGEDDIERFDDQYGREIQPLPKQK